VGEGGTRPRSGRETAGPAAAGKTARGPELRKRAAEPNRGWSEVTWATNATCN
jgi:hypothetical protein